MMASMLTCRFLSSSVPSKSMNGQVGFQRFRSQTPSIPAAVVVSANDCTFVHEVIVSSQSIYELFPRSSVLKAFKQAILVEKERPGSKRGF